MYMFYYYYSFVKVSALYVIYNILFIIQTALLKVSEEEVSSPIW